jgi:phage-related protein
MAGTEVGSLYYDLNIDDKNLKKQLDDADKSVKGFGDHVSQYWGNSVDASKKFGLAIAAAAAGAVAFGVASVKAFEDSQNKIAQTNAVLKSTGQIAGVTADEVTKLATALEKQTKFSDEDVRSVENLLLTFTSIGKDIFPQATKTVLDMATALGEDTSSASIQLGKALQDPVLGITALRRVGVNFTEDQKNVIQKLVETGQKAEAQKLILKELNTEFGGSAEAAGGTLAGSLAKLKNQFNNVQEAIGGILATVAVPFLTKIMEWFNGIGGVDGVLKLLREELDRLKPYFGVIAGAIAGALLPALASAAWSALVFVATLAPWALLGIAVVEVAKKMGITWADVGEVLKKIKIYATDVWIGLGLIKDTITGGDPTLAAGQERFAGIARALIATRDIVLDVVGWLQRLWDSFINSTPVIIFGQFLSQVFWPALQAIAAAVWQNLLPALLQLWDALVRLWNALNPALMDALKIVGAIIFGVLLVAIWAALSVLNILIQVFAGVVSAISIVIGWVANLIGWFGNLVGTVWNIVRTIATIMWNLPQAFKDVVGTLFAIAGGLAGGILHAIGNLGGLLYNAGKDLIAGMINGITDKFKELAGAVKNAVGNAVGAVKGFLGIHSPSTVFHEIGTNVTEGFVKGINDSSDMAIQAMGNLGNNIIAPTLAVTQSTPVAGGSSSSPSTIINQFSGDIHLGDIGAAQTFFDKLDRNTYLESIGVSPQ